MHRKKEREKIAKAEGGQMNQKELIPGLNNMKQRRAKLQEKVDVTAEEIDEYFVKVEDRLAKEREATALAKA